MTYDPGKEAIIRELTEIRGMVAELEKKIGNVLEEKETDGKDPAIFGLGKTLAGKYEEAGRTDITFFSPFADGNHFDLWQMNGRVMRVGDGMARIRCSFQDRENGCLFSWVFDSGQGDGSLEGNEILGSFEDVFISLVGLMAELNRDRGCRFSPIIGRLVNPVFEPGADDTMPALLMFARPEDRGYAISYMVPERDADGCITGNDRLDMTVKVRICQDPEKAGKPGEWILDASSDTGDRISTDDEETAIRFMDEEIGKVSGTAGTFQIAFGTPGEIMQFERE